MEVPLAHRQVRTRPRPPRKPTTDGRREGTPWRAPRASRASGEQRDGLPLAHREPKQLAQDQQRAGRVNEGEVALHPPLPPGRHRSERPGGVSAPPDAAPAGLDPGDGAHRLTPTPLVLRAAVRGMLGPSRPAGRAIANRPTGPPGGPARPATAAEAGGHAPAPTRGQRPAARPGAGAAGETSSRPARGPGRAPQRSVDSGPAPGVAEEAVEVHPLHPRGGDLLRVVLLAGGVDADLGHQVGAAPGVVGGGVQG
jgi:hypothetical protein